MAERHIRAHPPGTPDWCSPERGRERSGTHVDSRLNDERSVTQRPGPEGAESGEMRDDERMESARYDALVVGAGPAGASAAYWLAQRGHSVLIVDKKRFP